MITRRVIAWLAIPIALAVASPIRSAAPKPPQPKKGVGPIDDFFLPYPKKYSIPTSVQKIIVQFIQNDNTNETTYRDLYQDERRLKSFLNSIINIKLNKSKQNLTESETIYETMLKYFKISNVDELKKYRTAYYDYGVGENVDRCDQGIRAFNDIPKYRQAVIDLESSLIIIKNWM